ncbi:hypothetical protein BDN72DRAFT_466014 [Pluteus cervinus]|uniref:Uncharacterized protein n=1 Tax=Pluteus cervinus TaxID=181527 RepID=A0ACD3A6P1_9AGAR|nr:hypothetical protein BDN72DRAFT_466014 [Pluteus cervinus]
MSSLWIYLPEDSDSDSDSDCGTPSRFLSLTSFGKREMPVERSPWVITDPNFHHSLSTMFSNQIHIPLSLFINATRKHLLFTGGSSKFVSMMRYNDGKKLCVLDTREFPDELSLDIADCPAVFAQWEEYYLQLTLQEDFRSIFQYIRSFDVDFRIRWAAERFEITAEVVGVQLSQHKVACRTAKLEAQLSSVTHDVHLTNERRHHPYRNHNRRRTDQDTSPSHAPSSSYPHSNIPPAVDSTPSSSYPGAMSRNSRRRQARKANKRR